MALSITNTLPRQLRQPLPPRRPHPNAPPHVLHAHIISLHNYIDDQQVMISKMYNDIHRQIDGNNMQGLDADLPPAGQPGRSFFATDTFKFYRDTGSAWKSVTLT